MPADLKKVAREIAEGLHAVMHVSNYGADLAFVESRLQTLVSEVRAQAMEEAAEIAEDWARHYPTHIFTEPTVEKANADLAAGFVPDIYSASSSRHSAKCIAEDIRRRASGKDDKNV
jgi:hypothetical protein